MDRLVLGLWLYAGAALISERTNTAFVILALIAAVAASIGLVF